MLRKLLRLRTIPKTRVLPMAEHDRRAWEILRAEHPKYYKKEDTK